MNKEKLAKLQEQVRIGGKGTPRRKTKIVHKSYVDEDKKLNSALKKLNVQPLTGIEEVNFFREDSKVIHFAHPKVQTAAGSNLYVVSGNPTVKELSQLVPGILNQLGTDSIASLRKLAETFQEKEGIKAPEEDDDDVPELVGANDFEEVAKSDEAAKSEN